MPRSLVAEAFGSNVLRCRRNLGLSQQELSDLTDLHRMEISNIERGTRAPRIDTILRFSAALRVSPCELMAGLPQWSPGHRVVVPGRFADDLARPAPSQHTGATA